jgi:aminomethyltransferase
VLISATGYTGAGGVEIYFENKNNDANTIWNAILKQAVHRVKTNWLGARDTLAIGNGLLFIWK